MTSNTYLQKTASVTRYMLCCLLLMTGMWTINVNAQNITIGGLTGNSFQPIYTCYGYNYSQNIYTLAELNAAGFTGSKTISKIRYYCVSTPGTPANWNNWTILMGNTVTSSFAGTSSWIPSGSMTTVFTGTIPTPVAGAWCEITLTTPFIWNGTGNLVVGVDENSASYTCTASWGSYTSGSGNRELLYYSDVTNPNPAAPPAANYGPGTAMASIQLFAASSYCTTGLYTTGCSSSDNIQNISVSNLSQTATGCTGGTGIADYTGTTVNFTQNTTYPFTITCDYATSEYTGWWVDLNNNGSFGDAGEFIGSSGPGGSTITGNVTIPAGAATGTHRMRVRLVYSTAQSLSTSCTAYTFGETHDYTCNITAGVSYCTTGLYTTGCSSSDNIQNIAVSNLNQIATGCTGGTGIADFTGTTVNFTQNTTYPFTITCDYASSEYTGWWVDLNNNGSFGDAGEFIGSSGPGGSTITGNVTIPSGAATGTHRMRVRLVYSTAQSLSTSCTAYTFGETHDYTCNITAGCTQPTTQAIIGSYTNNTTGTSVTVNWTRGNGNNVLVVARLTATSGVDPIGGTSYSSPSTVFGSGSSTGAGNFAVYNSTGTSVTVTGLTAGSNYTFTCYEYATTGTCYKTPGSSSAVTIINPPPANDNAANAINIVSLPYTSAVISNAAATDDYTSSTCDGPYKNVWWKVTGICGTMTAITCTGSTNFDDEIAIFTGTPGSFVEVICNDDNGAGCTSNYAGVSWTATAGTVYYISIGSYSSSSSTGNLQLNVTAVPFTSSVAPTGATGTTTICNGGSTLLTVAGGTKGTGATTQWFTGSCGGTSAGTGDAITVSPTANTTYFVRYSGTCNATTCGTVAVTVNARPTAAISGTTAICNGQSSSVSISLSGSGTINGTLSPGAIPFSGTAPTINVNVSPTSNTTYTVSTLSDANCTSIAGDLTGSRTVNVNPRPTASLSGTITLCKGQSTSISVAVTGLGTINGTLSPGTIPFSGTAPSINVSVSPTSNTTYTVASLSDANCTPIAGDLTGSRTVNVNERPTGDLTGTATTCGGSTTLSIAATGSGTISGTINPGAIPYSGTAPTITVNVSPVSNTTYTLNTMSDANCTSDAGDLTGSAIITVNSSPVIGACPSDITQCDNHVVTFSTPTATGTPAPTVSCSPASGSTFATGTTSVTCTATNSCGSDQCSFDVTINETPVIGACPSDITQCDNHVATWATPSSTGFPAPSVTCSPASGSTFVTGTTSVTCTATNSCGSSSCSFDVTINESPVIPVCISDITQCDNHVVVYTNPVATGSPAPVVTCTPASGSTFATGTTMVNCTASNSCGNYYCSFDVTINESPVIGACPSDITQCDNHVASWINPSATGVPAASVVCSPASGSTFATGTTSVTCTATNSCGSSQCSFDVTINETPVIAACPSDITTCNPVVTFSTPSATGTPAPSVSCSPASGSTFAAGLTVVTCTASNSCGNSVCSFNVTVNTPSTAATSASSNANYGEICVGSQVTLTANGGSLGTGATWEWYDGGCGTGGSIGSGASIVITPTAGLHQYFVRAEGACGNTACVSVSVNVITAPPTGTIHYTAFITDGCVAAPAAAFTVNAVAGCTFYNWTSSQPGVLFNGNASPYQTIVPTVNVTFTSLPPAGASGWSICVAGGNACGNTNTICTWVRATLSLPGSITGSIIGCPSTSGNPYASASVAGAASYQWSSTGGITVTGNGSQSITVAFSAGFVSGTLSVHGQTSCGYNGPDRTITITRAPAIPGVITGVSYPCPNASAVYSVSAVAGAVNYTWTTSVPGAIVTGTTNSCSIAFPAIIPAGSTVSVVANSSCPFSSPVRSKGIANGTPGVPANISGPASGQCGETGVSYSITPVALATGYNWSTTCGTIQGPNNLSGITVDWPGSFSFCTITVTANNACGSGIARTLNVLAAPATPASVSGNAVPCTGATEVYSASSAGATSYNWTVPAGSSILGPVNGSSIILQWGSTSGNVTAQAVNACGNSGNRSLACVISCRQSQVNGSVIGFNAEVYPNPASDKATVKFSTESSAQYHLNMTDVLGQRVLSTEGTAVEGINMIDLDLNNVAKGVYLLNIMSGDNAQQIRVVVQ